MLIKILKRLLTILFVFYAVYTVAKKIWERVFYITNALKQTNLPAQDINCLSFVAYTGALVAIFFLVILVVWCLTEPRKTKEG